MMGRTEERLRDATTALGSTLQRTDIPPLRLPETDQLAPGRPGRPPVSARPAPHRWLIPMSAAASVVAVLIGVVAVTHAMQAPQRGPAPGSAPATAGSAAVPPGLPRYIVTTIDGQAAVHSAVSGRVIAAIPRPAGVRYEGVAASAGDSSYFLAGVLNGNGGWPISFFRFTVGADGRPSKVQRLPGAPLATPTPVISGGWVNFQFAVSPDGRQLAYASGTANPYGAGTPYGDLNAGPGGNEHLIVQNVASGSRRTWHVWKSASAGLSQFSWGPDGQLGYNAVLAHAGVSGGKLVRRSRGTVSAFLIMPASAAGSDLARASQVVSYTMLPAKGIVREPHGVLSPAGQYAYVQLAGAGAGRITRVTIGPRAAYRVMLSGPQAQLGDPMSADTSGRYLIFPVGLRHVRTGNQGNYDYVLGHLARLDLRTGQLTQLSIPVQAEINGAFDAAW
jgi:hypothetical protein